MTLDPKVFKAYDIRGVVPEQIDEEGAFLIGQAMARHTGARTIVVGRDMRLTSPGFFSAFSRGAVGQGADVIDIGLATTPMLYFAVGDHDLHDAGVMITASHNPGEYNGFKLCHGDVQPIGGNTGMDKVREIALAGPYPEKAAGRVVETDVKSAYLDRIFSLVDVSRFRDFRMAVDCGNGMEGILIHDFLKRLPTVNADVLYDDPDGNFPNHEANPLKDETLDDLKGLVLEKKADLGIAFDGDADRFGLVDERGQTVRGDIILALIAPRLLKGNPGGIVYYDVRCSRVVADEVKKAGGVSRMGPVGHGLIKPLMRRDDALLGGELSLHFYFRDLSHVEATDLVTLLVLDMMSETGRPLSELVAPLMRYSHSGELNFRVSDARAVMGRIEEKYGSGNRVTKIDGLRVDFDGSDAPWFFSVRASNTEPLLRLNLECPTEGMMLDRRAELIAAIREVGPAEAV
ncbi:phosphomannomutase/phosphoglucomutase [Candidatus Uhrbacteria bacterium]|nr:phosphomannomutase/phosphoglucomutase [Candidatus Uhrbacteria bacterium]